ncbi:MAG: hypothetical protein A3J37_00175 [Alphaproteobacteria bacterium RIFCSPHIGHO2_12_FULL_45_9]|nr:MAG: hypothetical protein A3B66_09410 [Alphaproteobacteria bacterium RIFCSPHIGHO2_02_FULL_46_13]OFW93631.1 MAG: hypothetical protein A3J37_00175 [Alphaproteobacteria bacterium RIFCSPHIGHO2_12_FULL_45_9]
MTALPTSHGVKGKQGGWTPEKCLQQSAKLRAQKIWLASTGPRTAEGKQKSSMNACKDGYEQRRAEKLQAQRVRNYVRLNRIFMEIYLNANKTWAELPLAHKAQTIGTLKHLENELGNLAGEILHALETDAKITRPTDDPPPLNPMGNGKNDNIRGI